MSDLAKRALACKDWRRMPGMLRHATGPHPSGPQGPRTERWDEDDAFVVGWSDTGWLPDLTDPATLGCLLALVREAWGDQHLHVGRRIAGWGVWTSQSTPLPECVGKGDTEAEALVAALDAAP